MAFSLTGLNVVGGQSLRGKAPQVFAYKSQDALATVEASGYFDKINDRIVSGDIMYVVVLDSSNVPTALTSYVLINTLGVITSVRTTVAAA